jgi:hypothetical protein
MNMLVRDLEERICELLDIFDNSAKELKRRNEILSDINHIRENGGELNKWLLDSESSSLKARRIHKDVYRLFKIISRCDSNMYSILKCVRKEIRRSQEQETVYKIKSKEVEEILSKKQIKIKK